MKIWYQNRMAEGVNHRGFAVPQDKYLLLTEAQAKVHNKNGQERVAKVDTAPKKDQVAVLADWSEWTNANHSTGKAKAETSDSKEKSSTKAKGKIN